MADSTATDLPDVSGQPVVGANSGIGLEATRELAGAGAHVVMACRRIDGAAAASEDVVSDYPGASLTGPGGPLVGPGVRRPGRQTTALESMSSTTTPG
jgi:NAD(P)-dependent dehydrogenase (short-subunit alcohol dehydrogenase family)